MSDSRKSAIFDDVSDIQFLSPQLSTAAQWSIVSSNLMLNSLPFCGLDIQCDGVGRFSLCCAAQSFCSEAQ